MLIIFGSEISVTEPARPSNIGKFVARERIGKWLFRSRLSPFAPNPFQVTEEKFGRVCIDVLSLQRSRSTCCCAHCISWWGWPSRPP